MTGPQERRDSVQAQQLLMGLMDQVKKDLAFTPLFQLTAFDILNRARLYLALQHEGQGMATTVFSRGGSSVASWLDARKRTRKPVL